MINGVKIKMDIDEKLRQQYFGGILSGDFFPKGGCDGIYCPDWDSQFILTPEGIKLSKSNRFFACLLRAFSVKARAIRVLRLINTNKSVHEIKDYFGDNYVNHAFSELLLGDHEENFDFCHTVTWLLQNGYIIRVIDRSI
jgi:hypothetical protein